MGSCISSFPNKHHHHHPSSSAKVQMMSSSLPPTPVKDKPPVNVLVVDPPLLSSLSYNSKVSPFNSASSYRSHGSREEAFYDTQGWLESDCEDDFYSVNGDFTPSRGNTPVHPSIGTPRLHRTFSPQVNRALFEGRIPLNSASLRSRGNSSVRQSFSSIPEVTGTSAEVTGTSAEVVAGTSPNVPVKPKKKRLADLFRESMGGRGDFNLSFPGYESDSSQRVGTSPNSPALPPKPRMGTSPLSRVKSASRNNKGTPVPQNNYVLEKDRSSKFSQRCFPRLVSIRSFHDSKKASSPVSTVNDSKKTEEL